eukprot:TRINITY_DN7_c0_g2_i1.p1 TRINITY_DN7_c0_g2~~TRINITY_DN7_c0_g2_i1.p1  ORF type:complete len:654 (+),score=114.04 TRINITY_DN7_c0_g2_i1:108-2069(+)
MSRVSRVLLAVIAVAAQCLALARAPEPLWSTSVSPLVLVQRHAVGLHSPIVAKAQATSHKAVSQNRGELARGCAGLKNEGSYFTASLEIASTGQRFDVVADTGSDAVIIPSCVCRQSGECPGSDQCFESHRRFSWHMLFGRHQDDSDVVMDLEFGSGSIKAEVTSEAVRLGAIEASMHEGLLLMVGRHLDITGSFEGILGLGMLQSEFSPALPEIQGGERATWDLPSAAPQDEPRDSQNSADPASKGNGTSAAANVSSDGVYIPGFLRSANVSRFSICFNDGTLPGVLRLDPPASSTGEPSVGTLHWGLNFRGFSVGSAYVPVLFCGDEAELAPQPSPPPLPLQFDNMPDAVAPEDRLMFRRRALHASAPASARPVAPSVEAAASAPPRRCGAIPDSGTTVMLGPERHVKALLVGICDGWPRCLAAAAPGGEFEDRPKEQVVQLLLGRCETWLRNGTGSLEELPSIYMHLGNANRNRSLELSAWSYVIETPTSEMEANSRLLGRIGVSFASVGNNAQPQPEYSCAPAFGVSEYTEDENDDVWILGAPVFYEYVVGFDRSTSPPEVTFSSEACGSCAESDGDVATARGAGTNVAGLQVASADGRSGNNVALAEFRGRQRQVRTPRRVHRGPRIGQSWRRGHARKAPARDASVAS